MKLQIGNVTLPNPVVLAPMAGVTDCHFVCCAKNRAWDFYVWRWSVPRQSIIRIKIHRI